MNVTLLGGLEGSSEAITATMTSLTSIIVNPLSDVLSICSGSSPAEEGTTRTSIMNVIEGFVRHYSQKLSKEDFSDVIMGRDDYLISLRERFSNRNTKRVSDAMLDSLKSDLSAFYESLQDNFSRLQQRQRADAELAESLAIQRQKADAELAASQESLAIQRQNSEFQQALALLNSPAFNSLPSEIQETVYKKLVQFSGNL